MIVEQSSVIMVATDDSLAHHLRTMASCMSLRDGHGGRRSRAMMRPPHTNTIQDTSVRHVAFETSLTHRKLTIIGTKSPLTISHSKIYQVRVWKGFFFFDSFFGRLNIKSTWSVYSNGRPCWHIIKISCSLCSAFLQSFKSNQEFLDVDIEVSLVGQKL